MDLLQEHILTRLRSGLEEYLVELLFDGLAINKNVILSKESPILTNLERIRMRNKGQRERNHVEIEMNIGEAWTYENVYDIESNVLDNAILVVHHLRGNGNDRCAGEGFIQVQVCIRSLFL